MGLVDVLKALGEPMRLRIMNLLAADTLCVCDLETVLNLTQSNASRHLSTLRRAGLIVSEKKAQWVFYSLNPEVVDVYPFLRELFAREFEKNKHCQADRETLKRYKDLGCGCDACKESERSGAKCQK